MTTTTEKLAQLIPEGWQLIKKSRLAEIARLAEDPSEACYEGRGLYDDRQVRSNWNMCTSRLEEIRDEVLRATKWGHDDDDLVEALAAHSAAQAQASEELPNVVKTAPERIYLVIGEDCPPESAFADCSEVTWCEDKIDDNSIGYVREDLAGREFAQASEDEREEFVNEFGADPEDMHPIAWEAWQARAGRASAQAVPAGSVLVPVEPTKEMLDAVVTSLDDHLLGSAAEQQYRDDWAAMIAAATKGD